MHESTVWQETWRYECLACLHEWQEEFEVGHCADGHGGDAVVYHRMGYRCVCPWVELFCPSCGGYNVKIFPTGWGRVARLPRQRHGELETLFHQNEPNT